MMQEHLSAGNSNEHFFVLLLSFFFNEYCFVTYVCGIEPLIPRILLLLPVAHLLEDWGNAKFAGPS